jgi:L-asparaginase II
MTELLVNVWRGELVESRHFGNVVVADRDGRVLYALGDPKTVTYWRSSAKPFQAIPLIERGGIEKYGLTDQEIAMMCASHGGEEAHVQVISALLVKAGFPPQALQCGVGIPSHLKSAENILISQKTYTVLHHNCSGKHAGMLALAGLLGVGTENYFLADHPVQQVMLNAVSDCTEVPVNNMMLGIDGCGVPVYGLPLINMALAYAKLAKPEGCVEAQRAEAMRRICQAMTGEPYYVAGTDRLDTDLMRITRGRIVAKVGAEAVYGLGIVNEGVGIAVKIADGNQRGVGPVIISVLKKLGWLTTQELERLQKYWSPPLYNSRREIIGHIESVIDTN